MYKPLVIKGNYLRIEDSWSGQRSDDHNKTNYFWTFKKMRQSTPLSKVNPYRESLKLHRNIILIDISVIPICQIKICPLFRRLYLDKCKNKQNVFEGYKNF